MFDYVACNNFVDVFNTGHIKTNDLESKFKDRIYDKLGLKVLFITFGCAHKVSQASVRLYIDFNESASETKTLADRLITNEVIGQPINNKIFFDNDILVIAAEVEKIFLDVFGIAENEFAEFYVYAYNFFRSSLARMHSLQDNCMHGYAERTFGLGAGDVKVLAWYEPSITFVAYNKPAYEVLLKNKHKLKKECYRLMKVFDRFGRLTLDDANIIVLFWDDLTNDQKNMYARG